MNNKYIATKYFNGILATISECSDVKWASGEDICNGLEYSAKYIFLSNNGVSIGSNLHGFCEVDLIEFLTECVKKFPKKSKPENGNRRSEMIYITKYFDGLLNAIEFCSDIKWRGSSDNPTEILLKENILYIAIEEHSLFYYEKESDVYFEVGEKNFAYEVFSTVEFLSFCEKEFPKKPKLETDPDGNEAKVIKISNRKFFIRSSLDSHTKWESPIVDTEKEAIEEWNKVMRAYHDREAADRR